MPRGLAWDGNCIDCGRSDVPFPPHSHRCTQCVNALYKKRHPEQFAPAWNGLCTRCGSSEQVVKGRRICQRCKEEQWGNHYALPASEYHQRYFQENKQRIYAQRKEKGQKRYSTPAYQHSYYERVTKPKRAQKKKKERENGSTAH